MIKYYIILFFFILTISSYGQQNSIVVNQNIKMDIHCGFEDYTKAYNWFPVTIVMENTGPLIKGDLLIKSSDTYSYKIESVHKYIELPSNTPKKFELYLPPSYAYYYNELLVEFVDNNGKVIVSNKGKMKHIEQNQTLTLVLSREKSGLNYLNGPQTNLWKNSNLMVLYPETQYLPSSWIGYHGVDIIIVNNFSLNEFLDDEQKEALDNWVKAGGTIIVSSSGNPLEYSGTFLADIIPLEAGNNIIIPELPSIEIFASNPIKIDPPGISVLNGKLKDKNAEILVQEKNIPLVISSYSGNGKVIFLAFDILKEPFKNWDYKIAFWSKILYPFKKINDFKLTNEEFNNVMYDIPSLKPPSFKFIGLFLFAYILLVGPVNFYVLKKMDKREYSIITIPVLVILFSIGTYLIGFAAKGGMVIIREVSIVKLNYNSGKSHIDNITSLFSPGKTEYKMNFLDKNIYSSNNTGTYYDRGDEMLIREGEHFSLEDIDLNMWSMAITRGYGVKEFPGTITGKDITFKMCKTGKSNVITDTHNLEASITSHTSNNVYINSGNEIELLSGKIINKTERTIEDCCLLYEFNQVAFIGKLVPGENSIQTNFSKPLSSGSDIADKWRNYYKFSSNDTYGNMKINMTRSIMDKIYNMQTDSNQKLVLCGWDKEGLINISLNRNCQKEHLNLFICNIWEKK